MTKLLPTYLPVWENKLNKIIDLIKDEISKPKKERSKKKLKELVSEAKSLRKLVRDIKQTQGKNCPHCGGHL